MSCLFKIKRRGFSTGGSLRAQDQSKKKIRQHSDMTDQLILGFLLQV